MYVCIYMYLLLVLLFCRADLRSFSFKTAATHSLLKLQLASDPEENRFSPSSGHRDAAGESKRSSFWWLNLVDLAARLSLGSLAARTLLTLNSDGDLPLYSIAATHAFFVVAEQGVGVKIWGPVNISLNLNICCIVYRQLCLEITEHTNK